MSVYTSSTPVSLLVDACFVIGESGAFGFLDVPQFDTQVQVSIYVESK